jgi:hypothetical protein
MQIKIKLLLLLAITVSITANVWSQGCSDAGFCTMGAMRPDQNYKRGLDFKLRSVGVDQYRGKTVLTAVVYATTLDVNFGLSEKSNIHFKLPYMIITGNLTDNNGLENSPTNVNGLGDISISYTRSLFVNENFEIQGTVGGKIPTNKSDKTLNGIPLPMYYQTSLGSYDVVLGGSLISSKWLLAVGYQQALTRNSNAFSWNDWQEPVYPDFDYIRQHDIAADLLRGVDLMTRIERNFRFYNFNVYAGLLGIFRVTKDEILDRSTNERVRLDGTTGDAITFLFGGGYQFNVSSSIKFTGGIKITDRKLNPDGLTRDNVVSLSYHYVF